MTYEFNNLEVLKETPKAYLVKQTKGKEEVEVWIPRSVCTYKKRHPLVGDESQKIDLNIEAWFVEKDDCKLIL